MSPESNDWWNGRFEVGRLGAYRFSIEAWIDRFGSWRRDLMKRLNAEQPVDVELLQAHERSDEHHRDSGQP